MMNLGLFRAIQVLTKTYPYVSSNYSALPPAEVKKEWSEKMLELLNVKLNVTGSASERRPAIFVGNHVSYIDALALFASVRDISFLAKQELASWPLFGAAGKKYGMIFVKRADPSDRSAALDSIRNALVSEKKAIGLFPAGTTSLDESKPWKYGAFRLAHSLGVPIQVFRLKYQPLRRPAFIDDDSLLIHLLKVCSGEPIHATLEFAPPVIITSPAEECARWQAWAAEANRI